MLPSLVESPTHVIAYQLGMQLYISYPCNYASCFGVDSLLIYG